MSHPKQLTKSQTSLVVARCQLLPPANLQVELFWITKCLTEQWKLFQPLVGMGFIPKILNETYIGGLRHCMASSLNPMSLNSTCKWITKKGSESSCSSSPSTRNSPCSCNYGVKTVLWFCVLGKHGQFCKRTILALHSNTWSLVNPQNFAEKRLRSQTSHWHHHPWRRSSDEAWWRMFLLEYFLLLWAGGVDKGSPASQISSRYNSWEAHVD